MQQELWRERWKDRAERCLDDPMRLAREYVPWFATDCGWTVDEVKDTPWVELTSLTLYADDVIEKRRDAANQ